MIEYTKIELEREQHDTVSVETISFKCVICLKFERALYILQLGILAMLPLGATQKTKAPEKSVKTQTKTINLW